MNKIKLLYHYWQAKHLKFHDRTALEAYQQKQLAKFFKRTLAKSPHFAPYLNKPLSDFPIMDKSVMMSEFDRINTAGLTLADVLDCAYKAEQSRDFSPTLKGYSVGLSSGTSGKRGAFLVSDDEQARWAGTMLAKLLPQGLLHKERIAFFLRANNNLYNAVRSPTISFEFFDLFTEFKSNINRLQSYNPTIIVAPASVLRAIALEKSLSALTPTQVISVAEVLDEQTHALLTQRFGKVGQVYQATEGFLACTCSHGRLHLNEEYIYVEKQWLDDARFVPVITDFSRMSQPVVRYRLDDVLLADNTPCPCGSVATVISKIEGRQGDTLHLPSTRGDSVPIFADVCERIFATQLPLTGDYQLNQIDARTLSLTLDSHQAHLDACQKAFMAYFAQMGVATDKLIWQMHIQPISRSFEQKRRRICNLYK